MVLNKPLHDEKLVFDEKPHKYYYGDEEFTSVTTWLKSFNPPFEPFNEAIIAPRVAAKRGIPVDELLAEWAETRDKAGAKGTAVHLDIERALIDDEHVVSEPLAVLALNWLGHKSKLVTKKVTLHPEVRVVAPELKLAGTIDLVIEREKSLTLVDWKTNKKLFTPYDIENVETVDGLVNNKYSEYCLQLSIYAHILRKYYGRKCHQLYLVHVSEEGVTAYKVPHLGRLVVQMASKRKKELRKQE